MNATVKSTSSAPDRNRIGPITWYRPPLWRGDCEAARQDALSDARADFRWIKADGYQRTHAWIELSSHDRKIHSLAGHNQETWDGGYIRSRSDAIIPGDRFGHLSAVKNDPVALWCEVRCDCGTVKAVRTWSLISGGTLSCGGCPRVCTGNVASCGCWGSSGVRWYDLNGHLLPGDAADYLAQCRQAARAQQSVEPDLITHTISGRRQADEFLSALTRWLDCLWRGYVSGRRFRGATPESFIEYLTRTALAEPGA